MSGEFVDQSSKADVTPTILKQLIEDAEDQDNLIQRAEAELLERTKAGTVTPVQVVNLAVLLVSSKSNTFIERGVFNLTELLRDSTKLEREIGFCALYHLALGHYKQGDPRAALGEVTRLLDAKSFHTSALALKQLCINRMIKNQKNSGIFSRLFSRKDDSGPTSVTPPPLPIMSPEEELQLRQEEEKRRRELASMFASTGEGEEIDEEELIRKIIAEDNQRHFDSASPRVLLDDASSSAGNYRGSYSSNASFSTSGQQRDSYLSDTFENGVIASPSVAPASVLLHHRDPSQRASMWVRSKRVTQDLTGFSDARHGKPHDSLPVSLLKKKTRPLRASQSARSSPSAEYLAKLTASSSPNQGKDEGTLENEEEEEEEEEVEDLPFEQPQFIFESYTPSPEIGILDAQLSGIGEIHARQDEELKAVHQANIAKCQAEYQALLQLHQSAQYELLRRQQEEVSELQNAQFALIEEEKRIRSMPPEEQTVETMQLLQQKMFSLSQRQGPLLTQQQQSQVEIVTSQQTEQKAKQEAFKAVLVLHNQQIIDLRSNQANEVLGLQCRITQLKQDDLQRYEDRRSEAAAVYRAHIETLMAQHQAEKDARQAASDARRLERQKAREQRAEEARLRREEARHAEEAEAARQATLKVEQQRIEDTIRAQQEALYMQQQEEIFKQQEANRVQEEAQLMLQQQQQQQQLQMLQQQQYEVQQLQLLEQQRKQELEAQQQAQAQPQAEIESPTRLPQQTQQQVLPANTLPKQPLGAGSVKFAKTPMPSKSPPPTSASPEVVDVFAIIKGTSKPSGPPPGGALPKVPNAAVGASAVPPSGKLALAAVSGALPPAPLSSVPPSVSKRPPSSQLPPTPTSNGELPPNPRPMSAKMPAKRPPAPPPSSSAPTSLAPSAPLPSAPPSSSLPPLPSNGPPPSRALPKTPASETPPSFLANSSGGRPLPPAGRPQPPTATVTANLQAFTEKSAYNRPAPPMPTVSSGPPMPRIPAPAGGAAESSTASTAGKVATSRAGPPMPAVSGPPPSAKIPATPSASAPYGSTPAASSAPPGQDVTRGISRQELGSATSSDTRKGITKDKSGLPVSPATKSGAHLLATASRAKGPARRPPGQR